MSDELKQIQESLFDLKEYMKEIKDAVDVKGNDLEESEKHPWQLLITSTDNGYLLENPHNDSCDCFNKLVVEEEENYKKEESLTKSEMTAKLLRSIKEYFGLFYSKHNKYNCVIKIVDENDKEVED